MQLSVSKRCVQLLSGSLHSVLAPYPGWPFELRVNQLCVSGEFAIYGVRRESADTLKVYCQVGAITLTWQSAAGEPHSRTLGSGECLQMHGEVHSVRPISDAEIVEQLAPRPQQRNS
jgi:ferric-dicitrate binding protein FerR (iron transport regulator)